MKISKQSTKLLASAKAVITLFLSLPGEDRIANVVKRVAGLSEDNVRACLDMTIESFANRHRNLQETFRQHFQKIEALLGSSPATPPAGFSDQKKLLLGAFFTKEYSIQSAALFNPSVVAHPDQQDLKPGQLRFVMSLRATGEGHISSIVFQTGIIDKGGNISLDPPTGYFTRLQKKSPASDTDYDLEEAADIPLNEKVIFPTAAAESMGMEDVRFVKFEAEGRACYYGTYTAYDGKQIRTKLIETEDFASFRIRTLSGAAIADKGMALFPEKLNGKYVMISRQGGEKINIMFSDSLYQWDNYQVLMEPKYTWELVQLGNCGSPIKTGKGWLLLTHGVGIMRTYVISAILLDLKDPTKIIGRLDQPFIEADEREREGYVPNVVYTCGLLKHGDILLIPYAVSDSATGFITLSLNELLEQLIKS
ncbi:MAG TPA: glycoside hydrolase family 130 protein [Puia sp.]|jgi:predicted GH43/DUF377 family glycosyl hydrolase|nr:glycoside hydrolase family 130 protein [Puia sp.]